MTAPISLAHSPCPNDTFIHHAWTAGLVDGPPVELTFADIDVTNSACARGEFDVAKVSYAALPYLGDQWRLLPAGGALGWGCGPLVLTGGREDLEGAKVAVPSDRSTAYLLFRLWLADLGGADAEVEVVPFDRIMPAVRAGEYDAGLVIHEARFTYRRYGLRSLADLGRWWEESTGAPVPLGAVVAKSHLDAAELTGTIRASLDYALAHPRAGRDYVAEHAQEMSDEVCRKHIELYVNEFSRDLGEAGRAAVERLLGGAAALGLVPEPGIGLPLP
ncbi:1,4-dihydroxy-6-naphthoate synthase [Glycomyces xiaoerkulensis]|uniref:1,4-dihydroxy-6-naphthoate synthase n=1 Tax=Glycomyces xiaoerkulensis TaxID=2038139 RepID=UPI001E4A5EAA|nr:1,4-dihydroxy-6-naphthoate synthase [Glycomyces xiaoerkulensis]